MRRLVTISFTGLDAGGGVPKFNRDLHAAFPDRECQHLCWNDYTDLHSLQGFPEWEKARMLNHYLVSRRVITRDDVIVADGFWAMGLETFPFAISHSHGIWGHITKDDVDAGRQPENPELHAAQVTFRRRWIRRRKPITAVSDFIAEQMRLQWGFEVDRVIDNGVDTAIFSPSPKNGSVINPLIIHGINDPGNVNKGWDHIELLGQYFGNVFSLDEAAANLPRMTKPQVLAHADLFVHPSGFEGNSMLVAEALACGLPMVGYNVGFAWRLWRDAGGHCFSVGEILDRRNRSPRTTLDACRRVLARMDLTCGGNEGDMGLNARSIAEQHLSIQRFRDSWREYISEVESRA